MATKKSCHKPSGRKTDKWKLSQVLAFSALPVTDRPTRNKQTLSAESLTGSEIRSTGHHEGGGEGVGLTTKETWKVFRERTHTPRSCSLPVLQILFLPPQTTGSVLSGGDKPERIYTLIPNRYFDTSAERSKVSALLYWKWALRSRSTYRTVRLSVPTCWSHTKLLPTQAEVSRILWGKWWPQNMLPTDIQGLQQNTVTSLGSKAVIRSALLPIPVRSLTVHS